jgi:hypothetical protein
MVSGRPKGQSSRLPVILLEYHVINAQLPFDYHFLLTYSLIIEVLPN